jgi:dipeptidyl aminopeptidase/acylaminoacyl peptidase
MKIALLRVTLALSFTVLPVALAQSASPPAPRGSITIDRIADIKYPTDQQWSPDGKTVAFLWDWAGKQDIYMAQAGTPPVALTDFPVNPDILTSNIGHYEWLSADTILFSREAGLMTVSTKTQRPARFPAFAGATGFSLSKDKTQIAFVRAGQIWVGNIAAKTERQLTRINDGSRVSGPTFSPDGMWVAYSTSFSSETPEPMPYNGNRLIVMRSRNWGSETHIVSVFSGDPVTIAGGAGGGGGGGGGPLWAMSATGPVLVREEFSGDRKNRAIVETDVKGVSHTIWKDYDPAWWSLANGARTVVSPDGKTIAFMSDRTGWAHLYVIPTDATSDTQARQLGKGDFGDCFASWSPDSKSIAFAHSEKGNQQERFISIVDVATGKIQPVVTARGVNYEPVFSADGTKLAYLRSAAEHPQEVYTVDITAAKPVRMTDSLPEGLNPADLTVPLGVHYPSRKDQKPVPATLMLGKNFDKTVKHPAIIWIHGSGADQNYLAWHPGAYRMYYSICQYFAQQGYVILTPDYRGSSGYSREWTTGAFNDLGGGETDDVNGGADYLKTLAYVDPDRIGVWGLSYGGFMTLQSIIRAPKLYSAAIDVAGVGDWETWTTGGALLGRLGSTPVTDPGEYDRSAPVKHLDKIERPLLILQGTNDTNVPLWETLKVVDQLEKLGKPFDMAFYPGEIHFFRRAFVLRDAWRRSEAFFFEHLVAPAVPIKSSDATVPGASPPARTPVVAAY